MTGFRVRALQDDYPQERFKCPPELGERITAFMAASGTRHKSDAIRQLIAAGLDRLEAEGS